MNSSTGSETQSSQRGWLRGALRGVAFLVIGCLLLLLTVWAVTALYFDVRLTWLRLPLAVLYPVAVLAVWLVVKRRTSTRAPGRRTKLLTFPV